MPLREARSPIARPRLLDRIGPAAVVLLAAPGGYGKTTAARQLAAALDRPLVRVVLPDPGEPAALLVGLVQALRRAGYPALASALEPGDPVDALDRLMAALADVGGVVLTIDEVHRATEGCASLMVRLAERVADPVRLVLAGRRLLPTLKVLPELAEAVLLGPEALRMDRDEVATLLGARDPGGPARAGAILEATQGWPAAVALAAALSGGPSEPGVATSAEPRRVLRSLVDDLVGSASPSDRATIRRLAGLPLWSADVAELVAGPGALERALDLGLPVRYRPDGWIELIDPVREVLPATDLAAEDLRSVARRYADRDALPEAVGLLRRHGDMDGVADLLAALGRDALEAAGVAAIAAIAAELPDARLAASPGLVVRLVHAAERRPPLRAAWIERALRILPVGSPARRAVEVERALDIARGGDLDLGLATVGEVIAATGPGEIATLGRARYVHGLLGLVADPAAAGGEIVDELDAAIGLLRAAGERAWEADAWQVLGLGCHGSAGRLDLATACLERAVALRSARDGARAATLTNLAEALTHRGMLDDAAVAVREADEIGRQVGDRRAIGYAAWSAARLACERRDLAGVRSRLAVAEAHPEGWFDQLAGIDFLADGADMLATCGDLAAAQAWVARAETRGRAVGREDAALTARVRLEAQHGDPTEALRHLDRLQASALAVPRDRWLAWLLRAVSLARTGRGAEAVSWLAQARQAVADQGDPERLERREPELLGLVSALLHPEPQGPAASPGATDVVVVLLGRFAVERSGMDASPPSGRPATLVKLLALRGLTGVEEVVDLLWEDADTVTGRARLRNLLNRVRAASGDLVVRRGDAVALAPGVIVDAARFEAEAVAALRAPAASRVGLARAALARVTGELLPADRHVAWAEAPRERLNRRHLALLDLVIDDAIATGDLDEAGRLLDEAIAIDPMEEERYVRLGRVLLRQGRAAASRRIAERALAVLADLDVPPGDALVGLLRDVSRQA